MSGIHDLEQPAKKWLGDLVEQLGYKLQDGDEPALPIEAGDAVFEFRLIRLPGVYERLSVVDAVGGAREGPVNEK